MEAQKHKESDDDPATAAHIDKDLAPALLSAISATSSDSNLTQSTTASSTPLIPSSEKSAPSTASGFPAKLDGDVAAARDVTRAKVKEELVASPPRHREAEPVVGTVSAGANRSEDHAGKNFRRCWISSRRINTLSGQLKLELAVGLNKRSSELSQAALRLSSTTRLIVSASERSSKRRGYFAIPQVKSET